jgi:hypothetical protein
MTLILRNLIAIPLFSRSQDHSSVPANFPAAIARSGGRGRTKGRRASALPWTDASPVACLGRRTVISLVAICLAVMALPSVGTAHAPSKAKEVTIRRAIVRPSLSELIAEASQRFGVPTAWIRAVMKVESANDRQARSPKGAMGLMQIMPQTYDDLRVRHALGPNPYDPHDNILAGAAYLREMHDRYGSPGFLAAYNAGPVRYEDHRATGRPLPPETRAYVRTLASMLGLKPTNDEWGVEGKPSGSSSWNDGPLFFVQAIIDQLAPKQGEAEHRSLPAMQIDRTQNARHVFDVTALSPQSHDLFVHRSVGVVHQ